MSGLAGGAQVFAENLEATLNGVLPGGDGRPIVVGIRQMKSHYVVEPESGPIPLFIEGQTVGWLAFSFFLIMDSAESYLKVKSSLVDLKPEGSGEPVLRWEFDPDHSGPASHWHVHAENGALSVWLSRAHEHHRNTLTRWALSSIHLPTGGERWRPCLEDFLEMTVREFGIDTAPRWEDAIRAGRAEWRERQLRTSVRDNPRAAAAELRDLQYEVTAPATEREPRRDRIERY